MFIKIRVKLPSEDHQRSKILFNFEIVHFSIGKNIEYIIDRDLVVGWYFYFFYGYDFLSIYFNTSLVDHVAQDIPSNLRMHASTSSALPSQVCFMKTCIKRFSSNPRCGRRF